MYVKCDSVLKSEPVQLYIDTEIEPAGAKSIVSVLVKAWAESPFTRPNEIVTTLNIEYTVVYITDAGVQTLKDHKSESVRIPFGGVKEDWFTFVRPVVVGSEYVGTEKLKIRVMPELNGYAIVPSGFDTANAEGLEVKREDVTVFSAIPVPNTEIVFSGGAALDTSISEIIASQSTINIDSVSTATDLIHISGTVNTYVQYLKDGKIMGGVINSRFDEEVLAKGMTEEAVAVAFAEPQGEVTSLKDGEVTTEGVISVTGFAYIPEKYSVVTDAYSLTKELDLQFGEAEIKENICVAADKSKFFGSVREDRFAPSCIAALAAPSISALNYSGMKPVKTEGIVGAQLIAEDGNGEPMGIQAEIPFRMESYPSDECPGAISVYAGISDYAARLRQGGTIELSGEIAVCVLSESTAAIRYLSSFEEAADKELSDPPVVTLYIAGKGETLFDVAKALNADAERLKELNPELGDDISEGDKIIYYEN